MRMDLGEIGSKTSFEEEPNTNVVPFDAGFPGTLPVSPLSPFVHTFRLINGSLLVAAIGSYYFRS
jgi:Asp-tRNA(Asn)/Glu-tRNA(Gln) amidotransferase B subunit